MSEKMAAWKNAGLAIAAFILYTLLPGYNASAVAASGADSTITLFPSILLQGIVQHAGVRSQFVEGRPRLIFVAKRNCSECARVYGALPPMLGTTWQDFNLSVLSIGPAGTNEIVGYGLAEVIQDDYGPGVSEDIALDLNWLGLGQEPTLLLLDAGGGLRAAYRGPMADAVNKLAPLAASLAKPLPILTAPKSISIDQLAHDLVATGALPADVASAPETITIDPILLKSLRETPSTDREFSVMTDFVAGQLKVTKVIRGAEQAASECAPVLQFENCWIRQPVRIHTHPSPSLLSYQDIVMAARERSANLVVNSAGGVSFALASVRTQQLMPSYSILAGWGDRSKLFLDRSDCAAGEPPPEQQAAVRNRFETRTMSRELGVALYELDGGVLRKMPEPSVDIPLLNPAQGYTVDNLNEFEKTLLTYLWKQQGRLSGFGQASFSTGSPAWDMSLPTDLEAVAADTFRQTHIENVLHDPERFPAFHASKMAWGYNAGVWTLQTPPAVYMSRFDYNAPNDIVYLSWLNNCTTVAAQYGLLKGGQVTIAGYPTWFHPAAVTGPIPNSTWSRSPPPAK